MIPRVEPEGMLFGKPVSTFPDHALVLLRHKFCRDALWPQHGHRGKVLAIALARRMRMVAIEFWT